MVNVQYSVKRLEDVNYNEYYDCEIAYINASFWNLEVQSVDNSTNDQDMYLYVGYPDQYRMNLGLFVIQRLDEESISTQKQIDSYNSIYHITYGYLDNTRPKYTNSSDTNTYLSVGNTTFISTKYWRYSNKKVIIRAYFDTEGY